MALIARLQNLVNKLLPLRLYRVQGPSMEPTYRPGDLVVGCRWFIPRVGQVVLVQHAGKLYVKRIQRISRGDVWVVGDNQPYSTDSRHFGALSTKQLSARALLKF
jgi:phage repressor protein C with HTH and peptisase S24 domain